VTTWVLLGAPVLGLLILALAVRPVLASLARLRRAGQLLLRRQAEVAALRDAAVAVQERAERVRSQAELAQATLAVTRARRARG
jgi:hypothetical protein